MKRIQVPAAASNPINEDEPRFVVTASHAGVVSCIY